MEKKTDPSNNRGKTYWSIVWKQFKKRKIAISSLVIIFLFFFIAIFAPFLANKQPIAIYTTYGELYRYFYSAWQKTHENYMENTKRKVLLKDKKAAEIKFDTLKNKIHDLNKKNDALGNDYEETDRQQNGLADEIIDIKELLAAGDNKEKKSLYQKNLTSLENQKKEVEKKRKKLGGKRLTIRKKMLELKTSQDEFNIQIVQLNTKLNYQRNSEAILNNLQKMKFPVSDKIVAQIDIMIKLYESLFTKYHQNMDALNINQFERDFNAIHSRVKAELSYFVIDQELVHKLTFPVISSLSLLDIAFMMAFIITLALPLIIRLVNSFAIPLSRKKRIKIAGYFILVIICSLSFWAICSKAVIPINYKGLFTADIKKPQTADKSKMMAAKDFAVFAPVPFGFNENNGAERFQKPAVLKFLFSGEYGRHLLGTDDTGRDILSRMIWGARVSLSIGFVAVSIYVFIGIIVGAIAGYFGGWVDIVISRIIEVFMCFPAFFLILTIIAFLGPSIINIMIVIGLTSWTGIARLTRGEFLKLRGQDFVTAARTLGVSDFAIIFKHILPNSLTPVLVSAAFGIATAMLIEAGLSFLGFGVRDPNASWGQMISKGKDNVLNYWWLSLIPGFAIFISVTIYNLIGDSLREAIDPKLRE